MDMKKLLQAMDKGTKPVAQASDDMKRFVSIIAEGRSPTQAEQLISKHYTKVKQPIVEKKMSTSIDKYFKLVEQEITESAEQAATEKSAKAQKLAERAIKEVGGNYGHPSNLKKHISQTKAPPDSIVNMAKSGAKVDNSMRGKIHKEETEGVDSVTLDIPLMIRLLEFAREDAKDDMILHLVVEKMIGMAEEGQSLSMSDYDSIVGQIDEDAVDDFLARGGKVSYGKYKKPRKSEKTDYGSKHIGGQRDAVAGKAGKSLGRAANTNFKGTGKPVVSVEAHGNSKIYDKCWTGYKKVPGKKRGESGSCEKK